LINTPWGWPTRKGRNMSESYCFNCKTLYFSIVHKLSLGKGVERSVCVYWIFSYFDDIFSKKITKSIKMSIIHVGGSQPEVFCASTVSTNKCIGQQSDHLRHKLTMVHSNVCKYQYLRHHFHFGSVPNGIWGLLQWRKKCRAQNCRFTDMYLETPECVELFIYPQYALIAWWWSPDAAFLNMWVYSSDISEGSNLRRWHFFITLVVNIFKTL
jgi:hypothetical protein